MLRRRTAAAFVAALAISTQAQSAWAHCGHDGEGDPAEGVAITGAALGAGVAGALLTSAIIVWLDDTKDFRFVSGALGGSGASFLAALTYYIAIHDCSDAAKIAVPSAVGAIGIATPTLMWAFADDKAPSVGVEVDPTDNKTLFLARFSF